MFLLIGSVLPLFSVNKSLYKKEKKLFDVEDDKKLFCLHQCQISNENHDQIDENIFSCYILIVLLELVKHLFKRKIATVQYIRHILEENI